MPHLNNQSHNLQYNLSSQSNNESNLEAESEVDNQENWFDSMMIYLLAKMMANSLNIKKFKPGYEGIIELSQQASIRRTPEEQQERVVEMIEPLIPVFISRILKILMPPTQLVLEMQAQITVRFFQWLVGKCEVKEVEFKNDQGNIKTMLSGVHIPKCKYLEKSGCVGSCLNQCKYPSQKLIAKLLGIPVEITPNFEDGSCEFVFGKTPDLEADILKYREQPCINHHQNPYVTTCSRIPK